MQCTKLHKRLTSTSVERRRQDSGADREQRSASQRHAETRRPRAPRSEDAVLFNLRLNLGNISPPKNWWGVQVHCLKNRFRSSRTERPALLLQLRGKSPERQNSSPSLLESSASNHGDSDDGRPDALLVSLPRAESLLAPVCSAAGDVLYVSREDTSAVVLLERRRRAPVAHRQSYAVVDSLPGLPPTQWGLLSVSAPSLFFASRTLDRSRFDFMSPALRLRSWSTQRIAPDIRYVLAFLIPSA